MNCYPLSYPRAKGIRVFINGCESEVLQTNVACFVTSFYDGRAQVIIETDTPIDTFSVSPKRLNISAQKEHNKLVLSLDKTQNLFIMLSNYPLPLFFYGTAVEEYDGKADYYFASGQVYEVGEICLKSNQSIYIEHGAVVKGHIFAEYADNIKIYGQGVLDNSYDAALGRYKKTILLLNCNNVTIENIIIVNPTIWMITIGGCEYVTINGVKEIGEVVSSDGIDVVGCRHVHISNCFLRNNDDCIVIKHTLLETKDIGLLNRLLPVEDVVAENCILVNGNSGNALEIGHELLCETVKDITFRNIDIVRVDGYGAAFSIHNGDCATVQDILYENIYVEHYYDKLVDFRIICSQYNISKERGQIKNITLKNIFVTKSIYNDGYSISCIGGYDNTHRVANVHFSDFYLDNEKVTNADALDLLTKNADNIIFE